MPKHFAVCLAALLLLTGIACGETEEAVEQASPAVSASPLTQAPGEVVRVLDVVVVIPDGSDVTVRMESIWSEDGLESRTGLRIERDTDRSDASWSSVLVDATTGVVVRDDVVPEDRAAIDDVLKSLVVQTADIAHLPWPYAGEIPRDAEREVFGGLTFVQPARASGIETYTGIGTPGGAFVGIKNGRSVAGVWLDESGRLNSDMSHVLPEDRAAFETWVRAVEACGVNRTC